MPADGLPLTIRVGCEIDAIRLLRFFLQLREELTLAADRDVLRLIVMLDIDAEGALRHIDEMSHGGIDRILLAEKFFDRFHLCRRLYDNQIVCTCHSDSPFIYTRSAPDG